MYTDFKKIATSRMKKGRKVFEVNHTYNADKKLVKTVYTVNGKLQKEWIYECKPEGELVTSKDTEVASVCSYREESADGSYAVYTRTLRNGIPYLNKQVFSKDSVLTLVQSFYKDSILSWERKIEPQTETTIHYRKSGKFYSKQVLQLNAEGNVIARTNYYKNANKPLSRRLYILNPDGTIQTEQIFHKQKLHATATFEFLFF
jgi:antitoxin component YwqK of YwqJK toxin-antitoxin module